MCQILWNKVFIRNHMNTFQLWEWKLWVNKVALFQRQHVHHPLYFKLTSWEEGNQTNAQSRDPQLTSNKTFLQPRKQTWQWKNNNLKMYLLSKMVIVHCHVSFRGCTPKVQKQLNHKLGCKQKTVNLCHFLSYGRAPHLHLIVWHTLR